MKLKRIFKILFSDWPAKVLSLSIALLLTLFFNLTRLEQRTINIPLTVSLNEELAPSSQYPSMVKVLLRGERDVIYSIREDEISASLDLSEYKNVGVYRAPIRLQKRGNALVADPLEIHPEPTDIAIGLEKRVAKSVPVTPSFKGFLESGFELANFDIVPPEVTISGPEGLIARTAEISTDTIELSGKKVDFTASVRLLKKDPLLTFEGRDLVVFSAAVHKSRDVKNFVNLPIFIRGLQPGLALAEILPTGNLRMHIAEEVLKNFKTSEMLSVDLSDFTRAGTYTVEVVVRIPEEAVLETYEPQTLTIRLQAAVQPAEPAAGL
ncbi:MAG: CdaR family protein [Spirochaetia bacterium]|jgi:YbbR domain-containing protein|nr:CdaR family protein [Spirochaetia bacterium]